MNSQRILVGGENILPRWREEHVQWSEAAKSITLKLHKEVGCDKPTEHKGASIKERPSWRDQEGRRRTAKCFLSYARHFGLFPEDKKLKFFREKEVGVI